MGSVSFLRQEISPGPRYGRGKAGNEEGSTPGEDRLTGKLWRWRWAKSQVPVRSPSMWHSSQPLCAVPQTSVQRPYGAALQSDQQTSSAHGTKFGEPIASIRDLLRAPGAKPPGDFLVG